jgi:hypothetical protein
MPYGSKYHIEICASMTECAKEPTEACLAVICGKCKREFFLTSTTSDVDECWSIIIKYDYICQACREKFYGSEQIIKERREKEVIKAIKLMKQERVNPEYIKEMEEKLEKIRQELEKIVPAEVVEPEMTEKTFCPACGVDITNKVPHSTFECDNCKNYYCQNCLVKVIPDSWSKRYCPNCLFKNKFTKDLSKRLLKQYSSVQLSELETSLQEIKYEAIEKIDTFDTQMKELKDDKKEVQEHIKNINILRKAIRKKVTKYD